MDINLQNRLAQELLSKKTDDKTPVGVGTDEVGIVRVEERKLEALAPKTSYETLDSRIKGWIPGHLYILSGETNAGKTQCACNFAYQVAKQGKKVSYFALEPDASVIEYVAGIRTRKRWSDITDEDLLVKIPGFTIFLKEDCSTMNTLTKTIDKMERQDLIIIDHFGYFTNDPREKRSQTQQESDALKRIVGAAKKHKCAIMLIAHLKKPASKNKKNEAPNMNDISGSAAFKQDATDVMILHMVKDEADSSGLTNSPNGNIYLPKVKTGKGGAVPIHFIPDSPVMEEGEYVARPYLLPLEDNEEIAF